MYRREYKRLTDVPTVELNTGARMPMLGLGTWQVEDPDELRTALKVALDSGYRLIDTAEFYGNEHVIGHVLEEYFNEGKVARKDVFIITKLPFYFMQPENAELSVEKQLESLRLDYIDLYLIHAPCTMKITPNGLEHDNVPHIDTWRALERCYKKGQLKAIGLSNFNARQIQALYDECEIKPANLQVEAHIHWPQFELQELCKKMRMAMTAYAPIGSPGRVESRVPEYWPPGAPMDDPLVQELAKKYEKSPAQILLRHLLQRDIAVVVKSTKSDRIKENISVFDFILSADDQKRLVEVQTRVRLFVHRSCAGHKDFPFEDSNFEDKEEGTEE